MVGKKETIQPLIEELKNMQVVMREVTEKIESDNITLSQQGMEEMKVDFLGMMKAIL